MKELLKEPLTMLSNLVIFGFGCYHVYREGLKIDQTILEMVVGVITFPFIGGIFCLVFNRFIVLGYGALINKHERDGWPSKAYAFAAVIFIVISLFV